MRDLKRFADLVDRLNDGIGRWASWLAIPVILLLFLQVPLREVVQRGNLVANDLGQIAHAALFMSGMAYAMRWDAHVRVDIFYQRMSARRRAWVNLVGSLLFSLPWLAIVGWYSVPVVVRSWAVLEQFAETYTSGYFLLKGFLIVFVVLCVLQSLAVAARAVLTLAAPPEPTPH